MKSGNYFTEPPFSGEYDDHWQTGVYVCRQCGIPLYKSADKFDAHCGWPAFDQEIPGRVKRLPAMRPRQKSLRLILTPKLFSLKFYSKFSLPATIRPA